MWIFFSVKFATSLLASLARDKKTNLVSPELCHKVVEQGIVEVFTAEEGVAVGRLDLENSLLDLKDTDVEGTTTEIKDSDTVGQRQIN